MPIKFIDGVPQFEGEKPIFVHEDGKEIAVDIDALFSSNTALNKENSTRRHENNDLKTRLDAFSDFDGISIEDAKKAIETVAGLGDKDKKTAEDNEAFRRGVEETFHAKEAEILAENIKLKDDYFQEKLSAFFANSPYIKEKSSVPAAMLNSYFGNNFKQEDGKIVGYHNGEKIFSRENGGIASQEESIIFMIENSPMKNELLKAKGEGGSGSSGGSNTNSGQKTVGNLTGSRQERASAIAERFPELND